MSTTACLDNDRDRAHRSAIGGRWGRRVAIALLVAFVALGVFGRLGYRQATLQGGTGRIAVRLEHPAVTRGGLPTSWALTIRSTDEQPLGGEVVVETTDDYFRIFDHNDLVPPPDRAWQTDDVARWEYDLADDVELRVTLDVRTQPDARWRRSATTVVLVDDELVAHFDYRTWVLP